MGRATYRLLNINIPKVVYAVGNGSIGLAELINLYYHLDAFI
jgi:hypothetical protein